MKQHTETKNVYLRIKLTYDKDLIFPLQEGLEFIRFLSKAECTNQEYKKARTFSDVVDGVTASFLSEQEYKELKMAALIEPGED